MRRTNHGGWPYSQPPNIPFEINRASEQSVGLEAWWPMLVGRGGQSLREMVQGNNGAPTNSPGWIFDPDQGWATTHDGTNSWQAPVNTNLDITGPMTVSIWAMLDSASDFDLGYGMYGRTNSNWQAPAIQWFLAKFQWGNVFKFTASTGAEPEVVANSPNYTLDVLHHVVGRYDGTDLTCWLDGVSGASAALASIGSLSSTVTIGCEYSTNYPWYGHLTDARIYSRSLSDSDIQRLSDPATRWELHKPIIRRWTGWVSPIAARIPRYGFTNFQVPGIV